MVVAECSFICVFRIQIYLVTFVVKHYILLYQDLIYYYSNVYKGYSYEKRGELVAIKRLNTFKETQGFPITALREIKILKNLSHPNVVELKEVIIQNMQTAMIFEYMEHDFLGLRQMKMKFNLSQIKCIMQQMLEGLAHLHSQDIIHRDIKPANILYNNHGVVKIADFGLARYYNSSVGNYTNRVVTLWYRAPEILLGSKNYNNKIDIWSVGCFFVELLINKPLFQGDNEKRQLETIYEIMGSIEDQQYPLYPDLGPKKLYQECLKYYILSNNQDVDDITIDLIYNMLQCNPQKRFDAAKCLNHPFFSENVAQLQSMPKIDNESHGDLKKKKNQYHTVSKKQYIASQTFSKDTAKQEALDPSILEPKINQNNLINIQLIQNYNFNVFSTRDSQTFKNSKPTSSDRQWQHKNKYNFEQSDQIIKKVKKQNSNYFQKFKDQ